MAGIGTSALSTTGGGGGVATADSVSSVNSTTTPLSGNASFTGTGVSMLGYVAIEVLIFADQNSAANGVQIQFSSDNTNWDDASTYTYTSGNAAPNAGQVYIAPVRAQYCRVKYTNGSSAQTTFRLNTVFKTGHPTAETIPMSDVPTAFGSHGLLTKSAIVGKTTAGGGSFVDVKVNPSGALTAAVTTDGTIGSAVPTDAYYIGVSDGTNLRGVLDMSNAEGASGVGKLGVGIWLSDGGTPNFYRLQGNNASGDADPNTRVGAIVNSRNLIFNGSTFDRMKAANTASGTSGTGLLGAGIFGFDGANWQTPSIYIPGDTDSNDLALEVMSRSQVWNGSSWARMPGTTAGVKVHGQVATNTAITGNPLNLGAQAVSSENSAVTTARQVQLVADLVGKLIVLPYANPENFVSGRATATDTTSTSLIGAPATGLRNYITQITVWNSSATSTYIKIQDGSGGTELYDIPAPAGGGSTLTLPVPLRQPTTATAIFFAANASANAVFVSASGYKGV